MAISEDTAANVAAQLTVAWSNIFTAHSTIGWVPEDQMQACVAATYERFRAGLLDKRFGTDGYNLASLL